MNVARQKNPAMTRRRISKWLGIATTSLKDEALARIKSLLITARRNGDDSQCAVLSNVKEFVKRRFPKKCDVEGCPVVVQSVSRCCFVHSLSKAKTILLLAGLCVSCKTETPKRADIPQQLADIPQRAVARPVVNESLTVIPPVNQSLMWDSGYTQWKVYVGTNRNKWTTNFLTFNKSVPYDPTKFYGVTPVVNGIEGKLAYWPSNRVVNIVVEVSDSPSGNFVGSFTWMTYTNKTLGQKKFMRLNEQFVRWE